MRSGAELIHRAERRIGFTAADIISTVGTKLTSLMRAAMSAFEVPGQSGHQAQPSRRLLMTRSGHLSP